MNNKNVVLFIELENSTAIEQRDTAVEYFKKEYGRPAAQQAAEANIRFRMLSLLCNALSLDEPDVTLRISWSDKQREFSDLARACHTIYTDAIKQEEKS